MALYRWADGAHFGGDVEPVAVELKTLTHRTAAEIVQHAQCPDSALHQYIWKLSDAAAAFEHRCAVARALQRSVVVVWQDGSGAERERHAFRMVHVERQQEASADDTANDARVLVTDEEVRANPNWQRQVIARLRSAILGAQRDLAQLNSPLTRALPRVAKLVETELARL